jgi:serine phosphatase RsbU (regulator of sigma subunit)/HAMP domain-containing protein
MTMVRGSTQLILLLLGLGGGIALVISRVLLLPVRHLADGLEALRRQDFRQRIPVLGQDEWGRLSIAFNDLMENLGDLEVARVVQDTLFPQEPLSGEGWEVHGASYAATRVGGDYFDYIPRPDGRWIIVIGDVAGHGIPAALIVGMAKALVFHPANPAPPHEMLALLNHCLLTVLKIKRKMSCFLGLFDPRTGELLAASAGHCYPVVVDTGVDHPRRAQEWKIRGFPLGTKPGQPYEAYSRVLRPTEVVVLYTDGLTDALDVPGGQAGYERLVAALPSLVAATPRHTEQAIVAWQKGLTPPGPRPDDITLLILQGSASCDQGIRGQRRTTDPELSDPPVFGVLP